MKNQMMNKTTFKNGKPFYPGEIIENLTRKKWLKRKQRNKPNLIVLDGVSSSGKTTLAVHCMDEIHKQLGLPPIDINKDCIQIGTGVNDFIKKLKLASEQKLPCICFDEAGEYNKRGWNSQLNRVMDSIMDTFRAYNIIIFMVLHDFSELPKHVWSTRIVSTLIHLKERRKDYGRAFFYTQKRLYWIIKFKKDAVHPEDAYNKEHYNAKIVFRNLTDERSKALDLVSTLHKRNKLDRSEIKLNGQLSSKELSEKIGFSHIWIKQKLIKLNAKPEQIIKKTKYYNPNIIYRLQQEIKRRN